MTYGAEDAGSGCGRREFLKRVSVSAAASMTAATSLGAAAKARGAATEGIGAKLPFVSLGRHKVTRLITGYNPVGGFSHSSPTLSRVMKEYFTVERTVEFLRHCEKMGINTFQFDLTDKTEAAVETLRRHGSDLQFICLHKPVPLGAPLDHVTKFKPIAIAHHGGVTDAAFRENKGGQGT